uniref:Alpha N-terminal protein methyltransferase 1 n=1 Tax=Myxobolus squamalis TaxID=59785 RepID=A0A6B2G2Y8_MYXSQ
MDSVVFRISLFQDVGCGIGRVTQELLCQYVENIDLVDASKKFINTAKESLKRFKNYRYFVQDIERFIPQPRKYDIIWAQWVLGYLSDDEFSRFLTRCAAALSSPSCFIVIKDNINTTRWVDLVDGYIIRTDQEYRDIFHKSFLRICHSTPVDLGLGMSRVMMYFLTCQINQS